MNYKVILLIFFLQFHVVKASKDSGWSDFSIKTKDGKHIFVMLQNEIKFARLDKILRKKYKETGLYNIGNTTNPLYTLKWYSPNIELTYNGEYIIRKYDHLHINENSPLIQFYKNGSMLKSYKTNDSSLKLSAAAVESRNLYNQNIDTYSLKTNFLLHEEYIFDISTGSLVLVKSSNKNKMLLIVSSSSAFLIILILIFLKLNNWFIYNPKKEK